MPGIFKVKYSFKAQWKHGWGWPRQAIFTQMPGGAKERQLSRGAALSFVSQTEAAFYSPVGSKIPLRGAEGGERKKLRSQLSAG